MPNGCCTAAICQDASDLIEQVVGNLWMRSEQDCSLSQDGLGFALCSEFCQVRNPTTMTKSRQTASGPLTAAAPAADMGWVHPYKRHECYGRRG